MTEKRLNFNRGNRTLIPELQLWKRALAFVLDYLLLIHVIVPAVYSVMDLFTIPDMTDYSGQLNNLFGPYGVSLIIYCLYFALFESSGLQGTLGKRFLRFRVCDQNGHKISFLKALLRSLMKLISIASMIGVLIIDVNKQRQGLHDKICNTFVRRM